MVVAFAVGASGYAGGLLLSVWLDLPSGAAIVWTMSLVGAVVLFLNRNDLRIERRVQDATLGGTKI
jgi:ABC-type Mn2+/Zn2+ transport system permease subunit